jgi:mRNA interferase RelE/StbE
MIGGAARGAVPDNAPPLPEPQHPYRLVVAPGARRAPTQSLPPSTAFAAWEFISGPLLERPRTVGAPLRPPFAGLWRARRGEYRIRYRINDDSHEIVVLHIDHRRDAYRP